MKLRDLGLFVRTIRYLRPKQVYYQLWTRARRLTGAAGRTVQFQGEVHPLNLKPSIRMPRSCEGNNFVFINRRREFGENIDWNFKEYGLLWTYNLNYFDFLHQEELDVNEATRLIYAWCMHYHPKTAGADPYPVSIRGINWIKFFAYKGISEQKYNDVLYNDYSRLASQPEYHLLGNHLLENAFSLLFAAYYFRDERFYQLAGKLLHEELREQLLGDGGHFELSPMYHQLLLFRLLDCINLVSNNSWKQHELAPFLTEQANKMTGWLRAITFANGDIPMVNDAAPGIAPSSAELVEYAERLGIKSAPAALSESGYRMIKTGQLELLADVGQIGPDYIPGHAHSDTLNFLICLGGSPVVVDTGTSTYDISPRRQVERSTISHNTVVVKGREQSEVWSAFRVGRRARVLELNEAPGTLACAHDGYRDMGIIHRRAWQWAGNRLTITDELKGSQGDKAIASIHLHPGIRPERNNAEIIAGPLSISATSPCSIEDYEYADGFNLRKPAKVLRYTFAGTMTATLTWH